MFSCARLYFGALFAAISLWPVESFASNSLVEATALGDIVRATGPSENVEQIWVHADPTDGQHLIACGSLSYPRLNIVHGYIYSSSDAGATWQQSLLDDSTRWVTEASCTYGEGGHAYFADGESDTS